MSALLFTISVFCKARLLSYVHSCSSTVLAVVVCMFGRLTPDTLSTQTEAQDDAHRRAPILRHKASKSNWISTIFPLLPTKNTSVNYETHGK